MRAIITDIRAGKAAALAEDGTVRLVDAKNRAVGQEIRIPAKRRRRWKKPLTWAACVAVLCGMATTGVYAAYEPYASVSVVGGTDSVEYTVNRFDQVLGARVSGGFLLSPDCRNRSSICSRSRSAWPLLREVTVMLTLSPSFASCRMVCSTALSMCTNRGILPSGGCSLPETRAPST